MVTPMAHVVTLPPQGGLEADGARVGGWWHTTEQDGRIACDLCPRLCRLPAGARGFCFVRENRGGRMVLATYGRSTGFCIDPIEKKPLNHFLPGTSVLSFGTAGCNLGCQFCQNWSISKSREVALLSETATPEMIAEAARQLGCRSVAFTYNDPVIWAEYAIDVARACRAVGVKTVAVTAGYITEVARGPFFSVMDAANVDLKAFTEQFYQRLTLSHLGPVLETLKWLRAETEVWFEITNLVIPDANDTPEEFSRMCDWVLDALGDEVPLHFTAFHPDFRLRDRGPTPRETLLTAHDIACRAGLRYVYVGNVHDLAHQSTYCPHCRRVVIERDWYDLGGYHLRGDRCQHCGGVIAGRFDQTPGTWGRRRLPVRVAQFAVSAPPSPGAARKVTATSTPHVTERCDDPRGSRTTPSAAGPPSA
jgi:AmmeMemoRadiSam system radical SAM enzyme